MTSEEIGEYVTRQLEDWHYPRQLPKCTCGRYWHGIAVEGTALWPPCKGSHVSA